MFNGKFNVKMKKLRYIALALLAFGFVACEDQFVEEPINPSVGENEYVIKEITLDAVKGDNDDEMTRIYIGSADKNNGTIYYWHETDEIGVFALNTGSTMKNYEAKINQINNTNKNLARFSSYLEYGSDNAADQTDLFVYWPYNKSNVVSDATQEVQTYLKNTGVLIRLDPAQEQLVYGTTLGSEDHPSINIAKYGCAYDMTTCDATGKGSFKLHHQTAYLQFNAWGVIGESGSADYGNGDYEVTKMVVRLGKVDGSVKNGSLQEGSTFTSVNIAGNYTYNVPTYEANNVSYEDVQLKSAGGADYVAVTLAEPQKLLKDTKVPVFAVVNASNVTTANTNAIEATVTLNKKNAAGEVIGQITRTRYINLGSTEIKGGDYYTISYKVNDPTVQNVALDDEGNSNCYIISYPGTYTFDVSFPGNGQLPYEASYSELGLPSSGKFFTDHTGYAVDWLWASGASFDAAGGVDGVVTVSMDANNGKLVVTPQGSSELSGNLVVALHKEGSTEIIWTWHIWFTRPQLQHYNFPNTRPTIPINNEDWYMFDRNLGAETNELGQVTSYGLYYQLGRHVPFNTPQSNGAWPGNVKKTYVNSYFEQNWGVSESKITLGNVYAKPMTLNPGTTRGTTSDANIHTYAWATSDQPATDNSKTLLDPCPLGYKLPLTREWDSFKNNEFEAALPEAICSGVFGYGAPYSESSYTNYRKSQWSWSGTYYDPDMDSEESIAKYGNVAETLNTRMAAGDWFKSSAEGREYSIVHYAGVNNLTTPLTTNFPNTGSIATDGTVSNIGINFALWAAGRINDDAAKSFQPHWFGARANGDFYYYLSSVDIDGDGINESYTWDCYMPWHDNQTVHNSPLGVGPYALGAVDGVYSGQAAPVRCIREYNFTE